MARQYAISTIFKGHNDAHRALMSFKKDLYTVSGGAGRAASAMKQKFANVGNIFTGVLAARAVSSSIAAITGGLQSVVRETLDFDTAMVKSGAKFHDMVGGNVEQYSVLQKSAQMVGASTEHTMTSAAEALEVFAKAGMSSTEAMGMLEGAADLATVSGVSMAEAADYALGIFDSFGMRSKSAVANQIRLTEVNDIMTRTITSAKMEMEDFNETIKYAGSVSNLTHLSFKDLASMTGLMALANIRGTKAGTTMKNMLLRIAAPVGKGKKAIKEMGLQVYDGAGKMRNYMDIMTDMREKLNGMTEKQRNHSMSVIFGKRAIAGATKIMALSTAKVKEYSDRIKDVDNDAAKMAETIRGSVGNQMAIVWSKIVGLGITTFMRFRKEIISTIRAVGNWVQSINPEVVAARFRTIYESLKWVWSVREEIKALGLTMISVWGFAKVTSFVAGIVQLTQFVWKLYAAGKATAALNIAAGLGGTVAASAAGAAAPAIAPIVTARSAKAAAAAAAAKSAAGGAAGAAGVGLLGKIGLLAASPLAVGAAALGAGALGYGFYRDAKERKEGAVGRGMENVSARRKAFGEKRDLFGEYAATKGKMGEDKLGWEQVGDLLTGAKQEPVTGRIELFMSDEGLKVKHASVMQGNREMDVSEVYNPFSRKDNTGAQ